MIKKSKGLFDMTPEELKQWLAAHPDDPVGCVACGASVGCCDQYPNCPGNLEWKPDVLQ